MRRCVGDPRLVITPQKADKPFRGREVDYRKLRFALHMAGNWAKLICVPTNALVRRDDLADASSRDNAGCGEMRSVGAAGPLGNQGKSAG